MIMMENFGRWITNLLLSAIIVSLSNLGVDARGYRSIVLYTYDESIKGTQMLSMQLSSSQFKEAMSSSKYFSTAAEPLKFDDGYFALLEGKNTTFKLNKFDDEITCQCKAQKITTTTRITTTSTTTTTTTPKPVITTTTTTRASTPGSTYLPPPTTANPCPNGGSGPDCCKNGGRGKYCCVNGADNVDCCENGGKGPFCCTNGAKNKDCCENGGSGPFCCVNGANNADCCANGGKGPNCCTNGENTPGCIGTTKPITTTTTTTTPRTTTTRTTTTGKIITTTKFKGPTYLPPTKVTTTRVPYSERTYTWGSLPTWTYRYNFTPGTGTWIPYTRDYTLGSTTTTPKYQRENFDDYNSLKYYK